MSNETNLMIKVKLLLTNVKSNAIIILLKPVKTKFIIFTEDMK